MLPLYLLGIALLLGFFLLGRAFMSADPRTLARLLRWAGVAAGATLLVFLALSGRFAMAAGLVALLLPFAARVRLAAHRRKAAQGPSGGQRSDVRTRFLHMVLDHDSGAMTGEVTEGPFAGRGIGTLSLPELLTLLADCRGVDEQSAAVLEAYLDREHSDWRAAAGTKGEGGADRDDAAPSRGGMTRSEAYEILGLEPGASAEAVREAHRRLMLKNHPDRGGSSYLAAKINQAKDVLLDA